MSIAETSVKRPVTIVVLSTLVVIVALFMVQNLAVDQFPSMTPPMITVQTTYSGASPMEVEQSVTQVLEQQLSNISGLESMSSTSSEGSSSIRLEFSYSQDLDEATDNVRNALERVSNALPDGASSPSIMKFDASGSSIMRIVMGGNEDADTLKRLAEDVVQPRLERIDGVASADVSGGETKVVRVDLLQNRLEAYDVSVSDITTALAAKNVQLSGGDVTVDDIVYDLRFDERFASLDDIGETVVATRTASDGSTTVVSVNDVADVYLGAADASSVVYVNGQRAIQIQVSNESDTNSVQIAESVRAALPSINEALPDGVTATILYDETSYVSSVLDQVYNSAWQGVLLAMVVLFLFLRNWRTTLIIGFSIPISLLVTLVAMKLFDITLNMISLTGLILGLGMIVDNSIVILENIYRYRERGAKLTPAAILGSREMITAITASTLTTLSVFVPLIIWRGSLGMIGQMFQDLIFTVVIAISVSLVIAVTLVPALSASFVKIYTPRQRPIRNRFLASLNSAGERALLAVEDGYRSALAFALRNKALVLTAVITALVLSVGYFSTLGINFMPQGQSDDSVSISVTLPVGTSLDRTEAVVLDLKSTVEREIKGYERIIVQVGGGRGPGGMSSGTNSGSLEITLPQPDEQIETPQEIQSILRPYTTQFPDAEITFSSGRAPGSSDPIDVVVSSDNLDLAYSTATEIRDLMLSSVPQAVDPATDLDEGLPEYRVVIDEDRANAYGLTAKSIANTVNTALDGTTATSYWDDSTELSVLVQLAADDRTTLDDIESLTVPVSGGSRVALANLVTFEQTTGPQTIAREDGERQVHVTASLASGATATQVMAMVESAIDGTISVPDGVTITYGGDSRNVEELSGPLAIVIVVAVIMVFAVMASQFESLSDPFIIFFSIPLLFIGVMAMYGVTGESFSLFSVIGMVVLAGIVVNNGIVLVDYTNLLRKRGARVHDAVLEAAHSRLRPVLMTTLTTVLGMVPLAFFGGDGTEMIKPIGQTIVGGLTVASAITLFVTPIVYTLVNRDSKRRIAHRLRDRTVRTEEAAV